MRLCAIALAAALVYIAAQLPAAIATAQIAAQCGAMPTQDGRVECQAALTR